LPRYERDNFRYDVIAGVTVAALVVPKALGYAGIASVPLQSGLYAAAAAAIIYSIFGTSRQISTGPSSALAAVAGGAVAVTRLANVKPHVLSVLSADGFVERLGQDHLRGIIERAVDAELG
jgi:MFS superfamily sulfate permease-like transporter